MRENYNIENVVNIVFTRTNTCYTRIFHAYANFCNCTIYGNSSISHQFVCYYLIKQR